MLSYLYGYLGIFRSYSITTWRQRVQMDNLPKEKGHLHLQGLFLHADEAVYCKLMVIKWLNEGLL